MLGGFASQDEWNGGVLDVAVEGNVASVADGFAGFHLLSVSDPTHPVRLGGLQVDHARTIATRAGRSYVSGHRLHSIDVSDLTAPVLMGSTSISGAGFDVKVSGGTAFVAGPYYLRLFDVSGPAAPVALGELSIVDARDGSAVEVRADRAYLAAGTSGLLVVDVSDPLKPNHLGGFKTAGNAVGVKLVEDLAYVAVGTGGLHVIDVGNPTNLTSVGTFSVPGFVTDVEVIGSTIYLTDRDRGLRILESRLGSPQTLLRSLPAVLSTSDSPLVLPPMSEGGLPVRYSTVSGPATLMGNQLILTGPGTVTLRAEQAGDAQFLPASIERTFNVVVTPRLSIRARADGIRLDWPAEAVDYSLEFVERLGTDAVWQSVVVPVEEIGEVRSVEVKASEGTRFYRLRRR